MEKLVKPFTKGARRLKNHAVIGPVTRTQALNNVPNELMVTYYRTDRPIWWPLAEARLTQTF